MNIKKLISGCFILVFMLLALNTFVLAEEAAVTASNAANDTQWIWAEVVGVDASAKSLTLKYLDYETDLEKQIVLGVDENTVYENIKSFDEIKVADTLSVDYVLLADGKNIAKNISLEKPDLATEVVPPAASEAKPAAVEATAPLSAENPAPVVTENPPAAVDQN